jgi:hypothetical protein
LLGIADQREGHLGVGEDPPEDRVLHRVGVLELVDQRGDEAGADRGGQPIASWTGGERALEVVELIVERLNPASLLASR